jgi:hypothetical protein
MSMQNYTQDTSSSQAKAGVALSPEAFLRNWQEAGARVLRAQERMLHGMMNAARLELQFGQDFLSHRLDTLQAGSASGRTEQAMKEIDRVTTLLRDVNEELRSGFSEATKLLTEGTPMEEAAQHVTEAVDRASRRTEDMVDDGLHKSADVAKQATEETVATIQKARKSAASATTEATRSGAESN